MSKAAELSPEEVVGARHIDDILNAQAMAEVEGRVIAELKAATIALRDAAKAQQAAAKRYQDALQAFNRCVAPDNG